MLPFLAVSPWVALLAALAVLPAAPVVRSGQLRIEVAGGSVVDRAPGAVGIWANSPNVRVAVINDSQGFYNGSVRWRNVPAGSYLVTGRGVAEAVTNTAGTLVAPLTLAGGGRSQWKLEPNLPRDYRFAVAPSVKPGLSLLPKSTNQRPHFALEIGGTGVVPAMDLAEDLEFPTYLLPGLHDRAETVKRHLGTPYGAFAVGPDRFLLLDNRDNKLGKLQLDWAGKRLQDFRLDGARRVFVFMHRPPVDPRRKVQNGLADRQEARRLAHLLKTVRTAAIFAGQVNRSYTRTWYGIKTYMLAGRDVMIVESKGAELSVRLPIH